MIDDVTIHRCVNLYGVPYVPGPELDFVLTCRGCVQDFVLHSTPRTRRGAYKSEILKNPLPKVKFLAPLRPLPTSTTPGTHNHDKTA